MGDFQQDWRDASYLELALALQNAKGELELEKDIINEFVRREQECVTIALSDYLAHQKQKQILEAIKHLVFNKWVNEHRAYDECYMLAIWEILMRVFKA